jgi:hypothetical protein
LAFDGFGDAALFSFPLVSGQRESSFQPGTDVIPILPRQMPLLHEHGEDTSLLLSHYLGTTANSMANGSTVDNPFLVQLIPLAFSSELVLQLLLTQSAAQRAIKDSGAADVVATKLYAKSLRSFRAMVNEYVSGRLSQPIILAVGALIMCFTEVRNRRLWQP